MVDSHSAEQWPSGGSLERGDDAARTQKLVEIVIGSATAIALGVGCFFLGKFLLGNQAVKPVAGTERPVAVEKAAANADGGAAKTAGATPASAAASTPNAATTEHPAAKTANAGAAGSKTGLEASLTAVAESAGAKGKTAAAMTAKKGAAAGMIAEKDAAKTSGKPAAKTSAKASSTPVRGDDLGTTHAAKNSTGVKAEGVTLCKSVKDRVPEGKSASFSVADGKLFCWMRVVNGQGAKVRCVWTMNGKKFDGVWLEIGSPSWRTWASKKIEKSMVGSCKVEIKAEDGSVIGSASFEVK